MKKGQKVIADRSIAEKVYDQMSGFQYGEEGLEVQDEMTYGFVGPHIHRIYESKKRLQTRFAIPEEDPDLETILDELEALCRECGVRMFQYGVQWAADGVLNVLEK